MPDTINISLPSGFVINNDDVSASKKWTRQRNLNADLLGSLIDALLKDYTRELVKIAYKYNCPPDKWQWSQNKELQKEVYALMDELEDKIMELIEVYSVNVTENKDRRNILLPFLFALSSKGADNLRGTLRLRLKQFLADAEASIAAMKIAKYPLSKATSRIISTLLTVYTAPEVIRAYGKPNAARYLMLRGVHPGNIGLSSSGAVNVIRLAKQTAIITWMRNQLLDFGEKENIAGYYQLRGSNYPCGLCDDEVGLHTGDWQNEPYPHANCMCYRVPIYFSFE